MVRKGVMGFGLVLGLILLVLPLSSALTSISNCDELQNMTYNLTGEYVLLNNINCSVETSDGGSLWNGGLGFDPVGNETSGFEFSGSLDGDGYNISGLFINRSEEDSVGLFGKVSGGNITDVSLVYLEVIGASYVGGLVGSQVGGTISDSSVSSNVTISGSANYVGGLVGQSGDTISNSGVYSNVNISGVSSIGGLVGHQNSGTISASSASSDVSVSGSQYVGGLAGRQSSGTISNSSVSDSKIYLLFPPGENRKAGGLVGQSSGTITNSNVFGNMSIIINSNYNQYVGGLVGLIDGSIYNSSVFGNMNISKKQIHTGGLVGHIEGLIINSFYNYNETFIGGVNRKGVGYLYDVDHDIWRSNDKSYFNPSDYLIESGGYYLITNVSDLEKTGYYLSNYDLSFRLTGNLNLSEYPNFTIPYMNGIFDGQNYNISDLYINKSSSYFVALFERVSYFNISNINVVNSYIKGYSYTSGLIGYQYRGKIEDSSISNDVTISGSYQYTGGLIGYQYRGKIEGSSVSNDVTISGSSRYTGGLTGYMASMSIINNSNVNTNVTISGSSSNVGGLVGASSGGDIYNSIVSNNVTISGSGDYVGGLIGWIANDGDIYSSIVSDNVTISGYDRVGGLAGFVTDIISDSIVADDITISGSSYVGGLVGYLPYSNSKLYNSTLYNNITISGTSEVGGLVGYNKGNVTLGVVKTNLSGSTIDISGTSNVGGLIGFNTGGIYDSSIFGYDGDSVISIQGSLNVSDSVGFDDGVSSNITVGLYVNSFSGISDCDDLQAMKDGLSGEYVLLNNINCSVETSVGGSLWNGGLGFDPVGNETAGFEFSGSLDGDGYNISGLFINRSEEDYVGLFGKVDGGDIIGVSLVGSEVIGDRYVGGLVGYQTGGTISDSSVFNDITVSGNMYVGGLVGRQNSGTISSSSVFDDITVSGSSNYVGGLVGFQSSTGTTSDSSVFNDITVSGNMYVGGLVGWLYGTISNSNVSDNVFVSGSSLFVGGLVGQSNGAISDSSVSFNVTVFSGSSYVGGLVGYQYSGTISNSSVSAGVNVSASSSFVNGLVGRVLGSIVNSFYDYNETFFDEINKKGVGYLYSEDYDTWVSGDKSYFNPGDYLTESGGYYLINNVSDFEKVGYYLASYNLSFKLTDNLDLLEYPNFSIPYMNGMFDGQNYNISNLNINKPSNYYVGLFEYGYDFNLLNINLVNSSIIGFSYVGGLVGYYSSGGTISNSNVFSNIFVSGTSYVGGLVGQSSENIINNSVSDNVTVSGSSYVGGLVGRSDGIISNSNVSDDVTVSGSSSHVGGLVGQSNSVISNSSVYSNVTVSGSSTVGGLVGSVSVYNIYNSSVNTYITISGTSEVGGLVGWLGNGGSIYDSSVNTYITISGTSEVGGLVGSSPTSNGKLYNSTLYNNITISGTSNVGGLVGYNKGNVTLGVVKINSSGSTIEISGTSNVGGLIGSNTDTAGIYDSSIFGYDGDSVISIQGSLNVSDSVGFDDGVSDNITVGLYVNSFSGISDCDDLQAMRNDLSGEYVLLNNINCSVETSDGGSLWNGGLGFEPVGNETSGFEFSGSLDGDGYNISGLFINRSEEDYVGLFGKVDGDITDVRLVESEVIGNYYVGGLVGQSSGTISDSSVSFNVSISGDRSVGGLVGYSYGTISTNSVSFNVTISGNYYAGGLVGSQYSGTISNNNVFSNILIFSSSGYAGGLVGQSRGSISDSSVFENINISVPGYNSNVGGLVGHQEGGGFLIVV